MDYSRVSCKHETTPNSPILLALVASSAGAQNIEWRGLLDVRAVDSDAGRSFLDSGLGKTRYDENSPRLSIGQAVLRAMPMCWTA
jgi:hypothetical protein